MAERPPLPALTGLRFVAALQVVVFHARAAVPGLQQYGFLDAFGGGYSGVSLFFVLSGFVLAYNYLTPGGDGVASVRSFLVARLARIYAVYVFCLVLGLPAFLSDLARNGGIAANSGRLARVLASNLTLTQAWFPSLACRLNCPGWSLSAEAFFYLTFPLFGALLCKRSTRALALCGACCVALAYGAAIGYMRVNPDHLRSITASSMETWLYVLKFNPLVRLPEFVLGIALGLVFLRAPDALGRWASVAAIAAAALAACGLLLHERVPYPLMHNGLLAPVYCVLIFALASGHGVVARLLGTATLKHLGEASFALYLLHVPLIGYCARAFGWVGLTREQAWLWTVAYALVTQGVALAVLHLIEEPSRKAIRRWLSPPQRTATA